ncbi:transferrin-binding protein-like solute binding protein [Spirabiliibacterium falconis]|uniref:transferrin-binding protein-like solute binding protein n=1 Tax=Spirabiliibacterium falconis TaxID=572023 RepID=UPI001AAD2A2F|nr:transferrin-binding protein-like solute binding protein [Spirabiliibacterium falconis]MBE2893601.1 hypothetical protein [Spirabiliibacterium falconis]
MKHTYLAVALLASLGLVACSSSDDDKSTEDKVKEEAGRIEDQVKNKYQDLEDLTKDGVESVKGKIHAIKVGDKTYDLTDAKGSKEFKNFKEKKDDANTIITSKDYEDSNFGVVKLADHGKFFSYGVPTKDMPQEGKANYFGGALFTKDNGKTLESGRTNIGVDFGKRTIDGNIVSDNNKEITSFKAGFDKGANQFDDDGVKGRFYGENAAEISGKFDKGGYTGVFGGKKGK